MLLATPAWSQNWQPLVSEDFATDTGYHDLSKITPWGLNTGPASGFMRLLKADKQGLQFQAIAPNDSMLKYGGSYTTANSLRTASAIDFKFPPVNRSLDTLVLEFDAFWDTLQNNGEGGRIVAAFMHQYPDKFPQWGATDSVENDLIFGRPAYNFRILAKDPANNWKSFFLFYGGGIDPEGEMERYGQNGTRLWWLPGFIAEPGGTAPGSGGDYPRSPTVATRLVYASSVRWTRFRLTLKPNRVELHYKGASQPDASYILMGFMETPDINSMTAAQALQVMNAAHGTSVTTLPKFYNWFRDINGLRLYFRCSWRAYIANVNVRSTGHTPVANRASTHRPSLRIWPNPSTNLIMADVEQPAPAQIMNLSGQLLKQGLIGRQQPLVIEDLAPGIYVLKLQQAQGVQVIRFVKQ